MPAWDFQCVNCSAVKEYWHKSFSEMEKTDHVCDDCNEPMQRVPPKGSFILRGDGWTPRG